MFEKIYFHRIQENQKISQKKSEKLKIAKLANEEILEKQRIVYKSIF